MCEFEIYDGEGEAVFPETQIGNQRPEVDTFHDDDIAFAVRNNGDGPVYYLRFRARETDSSQRDIYYVRYPMNDSTFTSKTQPLQEVVDSIKTQRDGEWAEEIEDPTDDMLKGRGLHSVDISSEDIDTLERLLGKDRRFSMDVPTPRVAIEIVTHIGQMTGKSATYSGKQELASDWDLVVRTGPTSGIQPDDEVNEDWIREHEQMQRERVDEELKSIRKAVETLRNEHGLGTKQIRKQVYDEVPELRPAKQTKRAMARSSPRSRETQNAPTNIRKVYLILVLVITLFLFFGVATLFWEFPV